MSNKAGDVPDKRAQPGYSSGDVYLGGSPGIRPYVEGLNDEQFSEFQDKIKTHLMGGLEDKPFVLNGRAYAAKGTAI